MCSWFRFNNQQQMLCKKGGEWRPYERKCLTDLEDTGYVEYKFNGNLHKAYYSNGLLHGKPAVVIGKIEYWYDKGKRIKQKISH